MEVTNNAWKQADEVAGKLCETSLALPKVDRSEVYWEWSRALMVSQSATAGLSIRLNRWCGHSLTFVRDHFCGKGSAPLGTDRRPWRKT